MFVATHRFDFSMMAFHLHYAFEACSIHPFPPTRGSETSMGGGGGGGGGGGTEALCQLNLSLSRGKKSLCTSCLAHQHHLRTRGTKWEGAA